MPFNGSGSFSIVNTFVPNTTILSAAVNQNFTDIATGLSDCLTRDGQAGMTAAFKAISGSLSTPSITFNGDATSGLYLSTSGAPGFVAHALGMILNTNIFSAVSATVQAGGSGYTIGDTITPTGGTAIVQPHFTVATLSGTAVSTVTVTYPGFLTATATNPVSQGSTSGLGSGCTLNVTYNVPASSDYRALFTDQAGALLWQKLGASSFVSGLMDAANGKDFATGIGAANIAAAVSTSIPVPMGGGYLTPVSNTPIITADSTSATTIFYTPYLGGVWNPIHNGSSIVPISLSGQLQLTLTTSQAASNIYDVFLAFNGGTPVIGTGPSWAAGTGGSVSVGSSARGTGSGGTSLVRTQGIWTNNVSISLIWNTGTGNTTISVPANQGIYLGSIFIDSSAGQITCHRSFGLNRKWGIWNLFNRVPVYLRIGNTASVWNPLNAGSLSPWANNANVSGTIFSGLAEDPLDIKASERGSGSVGASTAIALQTAIGINSTSSGVGSQGLTSTTISAGALVSAPMAVALCSNVPMLGLNLITPLEAGQNINVAGTESGSLCTVTWRA